MNRRFEMYQYRQILLHMRQGETDRRIAKDGLIGRKKAGIVRRIADAEGWLDPANPLPDDKVLGQKFLSQSVKKSTISSVAPFAEEVKTWVENGVQASTIWEHLCRVKGFCGSYSSVRRFVQKIQPPDHSPTMILDFKPGEAAQVDFGSGPLIENSDTGKIERTCFFIMTLAHSRHAYAEVVTNQRIPTWLECHRRAFEYFGGVPAKIIIDNLKAGILRACLYEPEVQRSYEAFAEGYDFIISPCPPRDPEKKGRVESGVKYVKNSFMPLRSFRSVADANRQLREWLETTAGQRIHGSTGKKPLEVFFAAEKQFLKPLPTNPPELVEWGKSQIYRNNHALFEKNWYSAPYTLIGKSVWVRAGIRTVQLFHNDEMVAVHPQCFGHGEHQTVTDHLSPDCRAFAERPPEWCIEQAGEVGICCLEVIERLLSHPRLDCLRSAQRILRFQETHGKERLEAACEQALVCDSVRVTTIKTILKNMAQDGEKISPPVFEEAYQGAGRFVRIHDWSSLKKGEEQ
ncbi:MAG: IS21 family transposase [Candidatus Riflebacteria bacterium]|nr:IS21 family transposase [Candidatus Riflebacteria bacterium]